MRTTGLIWSNFDSESDFNNFNDKRSTLMKNQQERMIEDKRKTLERAQIYSYQGAKLQKNGSNQIYKGLMNSNKATLDEDDKILSIDFSAGFQVGDVFTWLNTGTKWIVWTQELTELAYFRGKARKCSYQISWVDDNGNKHTVDAAIKGPTVKAIDSLNKTRYTIDNPNYDLSLLIPATSGARDFFKRYNEFHLTINNVEDLTNWRIEAVDAYSSDKILEVNAMEYYNKKDNEQEVAPTPVLSNFIVGPAEIKTKCSYEYFWNDLSTQENENYWSFSPGGLPLKHSYVTKDGQHGINLTWTAGYSGQFELQYGNHSDKKKTITVKSLF